MSLAGVKKKCKKMLPDLVFGRLLSFVTDFGVFLAINNPGRQTAWIVFKLLQAVAFQPLRNVNKKYLSVPQRSKNDPIRYSIKF
jgi:hypothetical protein